MMAVRSSSGRSALMLFAALILVAALRSSDADPEGIPITYMDGHGRRPAEWAEIRDEVLARGPYSRTVTYATTGVGDSRGGEVVLLVDQLVEGGISGALSTFQADLESEGYTVLVWQISGGSAADIRSDLQAQYAGGNLDGAICIGDIPTGWMESGYGQYPVDVFLMDMNGTWTDSDGDGLYESWTSYGPEIWVGRLTPTSISTGSSVDLLNAYFGKNHAYRNGTLSLPDRALAYEEAFTGLTGYVSLVYDDVTTKNDPVGTCADDFKAELQAGYEWVHLISHSSPWGSSFHTGAPPEGGGTLNSFEVPELDPHAFFYVLNCCSNGRWTELDNLANTYIWCDSYGLAALAQAKVDYTNDFQEYYSTLSTGSNLGEAYMDWLSANMSMEHGAVLLGDPTLRPRLGSIGAAMGSGRNTRGGCQASDAWLSVPLTDGLHTQGFTDSYSDPASGEVFVACNTSDAARANILATHSDGDTWIEPMIVCEHEYWDWHPAIGGDGEGSVWVAWQSMRNNHETYDIFVSSWNGSSWGSASQLTSGDPFEVEPCLDGGNGHARIVWQKWVGGSCDLEGVFWTGSQWSSPGAISEETASERYPDLAWGSNGFGLVYQASGSSGWETRFRDAPDSGPFGAPVVLSQSGQESRYPCIACDQDGYFWVAWQNGDGEILSAHQTSSGWSGIEVVSTSGVGAMPDLATLEDGSTMLAWTSDNTSLLYSIHDGSSWSSPMLAVSGEALDHVSLGHGSSGDPWAVYGLGGADLQWDLHAARPDPTAVEEETESGLAGTGVGIRVVGPNPFRESTSFLLSSPSAAPLRITVFDAAGRVVLRDEASPGTWTWSGSDAGAVPAGVYMVRAATTGDFRGWSCCRVVRLL